MRKLTGWGGMALLMVMLLASCKSSKMVTGTELNSLESEKVVAGVLANRPECQALSTKMRFALQLNGQELSVGGNLRMKKDDVIQLSLVGFGIVEGGRIEFTQDEVLVVDRIHRQYARIPYARVSFLKEAGIDFYTLQALFWNELILPGITHVEAADAAAFVVSQEDNRVVLADKSSRKLSYRFFASPSTGMLERTEISAKAPYRLHWDYQDFVSVAGKPFPSQMDIRLEGLKKPATVSIRLGSLSTDSDWEPRTKVSKRYKEVTEEEIMKRIFKLVE